MSWLFYKRGTILPYLADVPFAGIVKHEFHPIGIKHPRTFYINEGEKLYWAWEEDDLKKMWRRLLVILKSPYRTEQYFKKLDQNIIKALRAAARVKGANLKKLSDKELLSVFENLEKDITPAHFTMNSEIDIVDLYLEGYLRGKIESELAGLPPAEAGQVYAELVKPVCRTYINKQDIMIIKAALQRDYSDEAIKRIYARFWWTNMGWENMKPHSISYFRNRVKRQAERGNLRQELSQALNFIATNRAARKKYFNRYKLSADTKYWLGVCDQYIFYHDRRKEVQAKTAYSFYLLLQEVARRRGLRSEDLVWLWHSEVRGLLSGKPLNSPEVENRRRGVAALVCFHTFRNWSGQEAINLRRQHVKDGKNLGSELKGIGVINKSFRGRVKVCAGFKEAISKIKSGDILVCPMTTPEYVPAMKKAGALITDEGGITCHAAIIARELKIPCIVGTKNATQVLKDGDKVEMDAGRGTIKILR